MPATPRDLRCLIVSYAFPPVGGAGVQRSVKLVKYLPHHGIKPSVLTVKNPSVPITDNTFNKDFPPGLEVLRARTLEPSYAAKKATWQQIGQTGTPSMLARAKTTMVGLAKQLLIPDPQVLWTPAAGGTLTRRLWKSPAPDVVVISAPPFSQFLLSPLARLKPGCAVVLDYRDEWSTARTTYEMLQGRLSSWAGEQLETRLLRRADAITTATEEFRDNLLSRFAFLDPAHVVAIPNGYDPEDFPIDMPEPPGDKFVISYAGTIFKLTSVRGLLDAVRLVHKREPELAKLLELQFMGRIVETELPFFDGTEQLGVSRLGYVPHDTVLPRLSASHLVLCTLDEVAGVERIYPAKIFELMQLGRSVLTLSPEGALTRLVRKHRLGTVVAPRDVEGIFTVLVEHLRAFASGKTAAPIPDVDREGLRPYHRRELAGRFATVMRDAVKRRRRRP